MGGRREGGGERRGENRVGREGRERELEKRRRGRGDGGRETDINDVHRR